MDEQRHIALPKLYGAPAYARPPVVAANPAPRPINPDDLPLVAELTAEDLEAFEHLDDPAALEVLATLEIAPGVEVDAPSMGEPAWPGDSKESDDGGPGPSAVAPSIRPRPFSIQDLADRIRGRS